MVRVFLADMNTKSTIIGPLKILSIVAQFVCLLILEFLR